MKTTKKIVSLLLAVLMVCSVFAALPFTASAERTNLALSATASCSNTEGSGNTEDKVNDGNDSTRWATKNDEDGTTARWIKLSFTSEQTVKSFVVKWETSNVTNFKLQYTNEENADDNESAWKTAYTYEGEGAAEEDINLEEPATAKYFRILVTKYGEAVANYYNVSIKEFELYGELLPESFASVFSKIEDAMPTIDENTETFTLPEVPEGFEIAFNGADYEQIIAQDRTIRHPLNTTAVKVSFKVTNEDGAVQTSPEYTVTVPGTVTEEDGDNPKPAVIPELAEWDGGKGNYELKETTKLIIDEESFNNLDEKEQGYTDVSAKITVDDFLDVTGQKITTVKGDEDSAAAGDIVVKFVDDTYKLGEEGYKMTISDKIVIEAETQTGFFWATRSMLQILKQTGGTIPQGTTIDYPKFAYRSFLLDVGRTPISLETLYNIMKNMSWYKMNDFSVHLYDNYIFLEDYVTAEDRANDDFSKVLEAYAAFRLESDFTNEVDGETRHLTASDRYYSKEEFKELIQVSRAYGVDIVPEFDSPAHSLAIVHTFPNLGLYNNWNGHTSADHLDLSKPEATQFIKDLWAEYTNGDDPVFDEDTILNIGGDEYSDNHTLYRKFINEMCKYVQDEKNGLGRKVRMWGSLTTLNDPNNEAPIESADGVQMLVWNSTWANPQEMYNEGFDLINILDGGNYIVPAAGYYGDYLSARDKYTNYQANNMAGTIIPAGDSQMLGGAYAIWNDMTDKRERGMTDYDIFDRFFTPLMGYASKLWGDAADMNYDAAAKIAEAVSTAPNTNPFYEVESKDDTKVKYDFSSDEITDVTGNGYDVEKVENAKVQEFEGKNAIKLNGGKSYASTPIDFFGEDAELNFSIYRTSHSTEEQVLFETSDKFETWAIKAVQKDTAKVGFSREKVDFSFNYTLPVGEWVDLKIVGHKDTADLYVNGSLVDTVGTSVTSSAADLHATLTIPFSRIGSETSAFKGYIADLSVYQEAPAEFDPTDETIINRDNFTVTSQNQNPSVNDGAEGPADLVIDGNNSTIWHSNYSPYTALPADLTVNMQEPYTINKFTYVPRQDGSPNGIAKKYDLSYSMDGTTWTNIIVGGTLAADSTPKQISFDPVEAQYVKFVVTEGGTNSANMFASAAEIYIHETQDSTPEYYVTVSGGENGTVSYNKVNASSIQVGVTDDALSEGVKFIPQSGYAAAGVKNGETAYDDLYKAETASGDTLTAQYEEIQPLHSVIIKGENCTFDFAETSDKGVPGLSFVVADGESLPEGIVVNAPDDSKIGVIDEDGNLYREFTDITNISKDMLLTIGKYSTVTVNGGEHGSVTYNNETKKTMEFDVVEGSQLPEGITFTADDGYTFAGLTDADKNEYENIYEVEINGDITLTAVWEEAQIDPPAPEYDLGDVDHSKEVNATDATLVLQYFAKIITDESKVEFDKTLANVDNETEINATDATLILQYFARIITVFPASAPEA